MFKLKPIPSILPLPIREEWDRLQKVISEFSPANGQEEQVYQILERKLKLRDAAVDQVEHALADIYCRELIERLLVADLQL